MNYLLRAVVVISIITGGVLLLLISASESVSPEDRAVLLGEVQIVTKAPRPEMVPCADQSPAGFGAGWTWYCAKGTK